jgi:predicted DsbA family dithiol-disulfide isomerase
MVSSIRKIHFILLTLILCLVFTGQAEAKRLTILYTGDTHAALYPCDCPLAPEGGIARRATAIKQIRKQNPHVLLLDSGGAFAGGIYDEYTKGDELDKARTRLYLEAMQQMGYDVLALGDEELGFGLDLMQELAAASTIPFVSANAIRRATGTPLVAPYVIKEMNNTRIAVIGLTTLDAKSAIPAEVRDALEIRDPLAGLRQALGQINETKRADLIIVLSHLGEKKSHELLEQFPEVDIVINGHRKDSLEMSQRVGSGLLLQFSYQGRQLGRLDMELNERNEMVDYNFKSIKMNNEIVDDEAMLTLLQGVNPSAELVRVVLDLYVMRGCPYCEDAEAVMQQVVAELGDKLDVKLYFIPRGGMDEAAAALDEEAQIQLLIEKYFPDKLWVYLDCRNRDIAGMPWQSCATKAGIDTEPISRDLANGKAEELLRLNLLQGQRLRVSSTPTLFINHKLYSGKIEVPELIKYICQQLSPEMVSACGDLPECLSDDECYQPGMIGSCEPTDSGGTECSYKTAVAVPLTIVWDEAALNPQTEALDWLRRMFPGIETEYVEFASPRGQKLVQDYNLQRLPAYLFAPAVLEAENVEQLKGELKFVKQRLLLSPTAAQANLYLNRPSRPGRLEFLFSPLSPQLNKVLLDIYHILEEEPFPLDFRLRYLVRYDSAGGLVAPNGQAEVEEARRQLVIRRDYPAKFKAYIMRRSQDLDSSYWEQPLLDVGLDPYKIKQQAQSRAVEKLLAEDAAALRELEIGSTPMFLVNNRELIELQNKQQFKELLNKLQAQSTSSTAAIDNHEGE